MGGLYCCVPGCANSKGMPCISFFTFPKDSARCQQWKNMLHFSQNHPYTKFSAEKLRRMDIRICAGHFENKYFSTVGRCSLKKDALPTLNLEGIYNLEMSQSQLFCAFNNKNQLEYYDKPDIISNNKLKELSVDCPLKFSEIEVTEEVRKVKEDVSAENIELKHESNFSEKEVTKEEIKQEDPNLGAIVLNHESRFDYSTNLSQIEVKQEDVNTENIDLQTELNFDITMDYFKINDIKMEEVKQEKVDTEVVYIKSEEINIEDDGISTTQREIADKVNQYRCNQCNFTTKYKKSLKFHLHRHGGSTNLNMLKCDHCQYQTIQRGQSDNYNVKMSRSERQLSPIYKPDSITNSTLEDLNYDIDSSEMGVIDMGEVANLKNIAQKHKPIFNCPECGLVKVEPKNFLEVQVAEIGEVGKDSIDVESDLINPEHIKIEDDYEYNESGSMSPSCIYNDTREDYNDKTDGHVMEEERSENCNKYKCSYGTNYKHNLMFSLYHHGGPDEVNMFNNDDCPFQTIQRENLNIHIQHSNNLKSLLHRHKDQQKRDLKIHQSNQQTYRKEALKNHLHNHMNSDNRDIFRCNHCEYSTTQKDHLQAHQIYHKTVNTIFKCTECPYESHLKRNLSRHKLQHLHPDEVKKVKCAHCDYSAIQKTSLKAHLLKHKTLTEADMFKCTECSFQTIHARNLKLHQRKHLHPDEVEMFKCTHCEYSTNRKFNLNKHLHKHFKGTNMFKLKKYTFQHRTPKAPNILKCVDCSYETIYKGSLRKHQLQHLHPDAIERFKCPCCEYSTIHKDYLKTHLLQHKQYSEIDIVKCEQCSYQTFRKKNLKRHQLQHLNPDKVEKYICAHCEYSTIHKVYLKKHIHNKHRSLKDAELFKCVDCSYQTINKRSLKRHQLRHRKPRKSH